MLTIKSTSVFYDQDGYPFKDAQRTVRYPITGGTFVGSHNTKQIRFYVRDIGGTDNISWVVLSKLPNGKLGYEICSNVAYDSELGEYYLEFDVSAYYTSVKGDLYLSLRGYEGEVEFEDNDSDGVYNIVGDPLIEVTGTIKLAINYSPMVNTGTQVLPTDVDKIILALNNCLPKGMGIVVLSSTSDNISSYSENQLFFTRDTKHIYKKTSGELVLFDDFTTETWVKSNYAPIVPLNTTLKTIYDTYGDKIVFTFGYSNMQYISGFVYVTYSGGYRANGLGSVSSGFGTYAKLIKGNTIFSSSSTVQAVITGGNNLASESYVNSAIDTALQEFLQKEYDKVDIAEYPTLDDFLASTGEEGYIYLYPINTSDESKGYYQYIWESNAWVSLGTTTIDLSGYVEKTTSANKVYGTNELGGQTTYTVDDFYEGNIARRDTDGSITVPLTPTQNGHASSKKYVDDEVNDLSSEVDDKLEEKANVDGNYPTLTAGLADNLTPYSEDSGAEQDNPFISNGTGTNNNTEIVTVGDYGLLKEKQGNSVVMNQLATVQSSSGTTTTGDVIPLGFSNLTSIVGHKYLAIFNLQVGDYTKVPNVRVRYPFVSSKSSILNNNKNTYIILGEATATNSFTIQLTDITESGISYSFDSVYFVDLTQMFNGSIPQDLLDHPDHFSWYYNGSLAYNTGTLDNANGVKLVSTGRQLWDEEVESGYWDTATGQKVNQGAWKRCVNPIKVIPNTKFYAKITNESSTMVLIFRDKNGNAISSLAKLYWNNTTFTTPSNCYDIVFYFNDNFAGTITISLYYETGDSYNQYYPYEQPYVVDTGSEVLRKAGSVKDYKEPNGTIHRRIGVVDLGTLSWTRQQIKTGVYGFYVQLETSVLGNNLMCQKYVVYNNSNVNNIEDKMIWNANWAFSSKNIVIRDDSYTDAATFKTAMSGVLLYYELATPTTEQGTPFAENLPINDYGMLYWLDENDELVGIPQGAKIFYPTNYKGFVDDMYMRTDGDASKLVIDTELQASETQRDTIDTQLKNAIGGTLRQCLCVKESLDFDNTKVVDLSELSWSYNSNYGGYFYSSINDLATSNNSICSKYSGDVSAFFTSPYPDKQCIVYKTWNVICVRDTSFGTDANVFKNGVKNVLLAYEKA